MEPKGATLPEGTRFEGRYEILGELGSGRFGRVYHALQLSTGQSVALKLLRPREGTDASSARREAERFRRETRICAALSHPNLVRLIDSGATEEGHLYAVFAYVPGETVEQVLEREGALGVRESIRLMTQVLEALSCAHEKGIVHRDLKPSNVMLIGAAPRRNAVVLDFGVGGVDEGRRLADWEKLTQAREFVGTPLYASPEQLSGEAATPRSDLYAWGLIFLECLTGRQPFVEEGAAARLLTGGGAVEIPEWLRGHRLGALLETVTAREAARRDVAVEALLAALDEVVRGDLPVAPELAWVPPPLAEPGERRHLTVMFCDLVGATALSRRLDAEAYRRLLRAFQERSTKAIERYEGRVVQHLGDGLLAYFGHPQAHDDDPERAVRAGRDVLGDLRTLNGRLETQEGMRLEVRVGIHTGSVVVSELGDGVGKETLALGDTPNITARLSDIAAPDTVVISEATRRLVAGRVVTEDLGTLQLKGIAEPQHLHRVIQTLPRPLTPTPLTPFVGREQELGLLLDRFARVQEKQGHAVWIAGEPGVGKTRLVHRLRERLGAMPHGWLECRCSPYAHNSALLPVIELVEQALRLDDTDEPEEKIGRLESALELADFELAEAVPLLASLLSLRLPERYAPLEISPLLQRQKTLEALLSWVLALGEMQPIVLLVEDLQWIDPSTLEWLSLLIAQCPTVGVLVLLTFRPEFEPPWPSHAHVQPIVLERLTHEETRELAVSATSGKALPEALVERIAARSDGVPLFVEELARGVSEGERFVEGPVSGIEIPETLQDTLMARLDRLGESKEVAQLGAALGREFPYALLKAIAPRTEGALREGLSRLVAAELLYQRGLPPKATYIFKHALVQDAAYQSLLGSQRRELHGRVADALAQNFPERVERDPEEIARHSEEAGRTEQAIGHYRRAGERATQHYAHAEAVGQLRKALELLYTLPEGAERDRDELQLQVALGPSLIVTRGYGHPELGRVFARARALCREIGDEPELIRPLIGLSLHTFIRGDARAGAALAEQALALAERGSETFPLLLAHTRLGINLYVLGEMTRGLEHLEQAIRLHDPVEHRPLEASWGQGVGIHVARVIASFVLWNLGYPDRARRLGREAVDRAREGDPFDLAQVLASPNIEHYLGFREEARASAEEAIAIARKRGFPFLLLQAGLYRGWAIGGARGLEEVDRSLAQLEAAGIRVFLPGWTAMAIELMGELGRIDDALRRVESVVVIAEETGGLAGLSEIYRLKGELFQQSGASGEAESFFQRALAIAREQSARSFELRAAIRLARLWCDRGRRDEARALLAPVYDWFTEGFDTPDLIDAKALLDALS